jgi:tyrosinase
MPADIQIPGADQQGRVFLTWAPVQANVGLVDEPDAGDTVDVILRNAGTGGQLLFATRRTDRGSPTLPIGLPRSGESVPFWVGGEFGRPSSDYGDAAVEAVASDGTVLGSRAVMVRVRKNAQQLTPAERDRFLSAFGTLNGRGRGRFSDFRDMHVAIALDEAHGNVGFLPWHRAYLLDLERELQNIDASVTVPYWRFDQPAPDVFTPQFMGASGPGGRVQFVPGHPLESWVTDSQPGITRGMQFLPTAAPPGLRDETATLALGGSGNTYGNFSIMEGNPHGFAHTSFSGFIRNPALAPRDPLFFLLHANVDRLWAKWQWLFGRIDPQNTASYAQPSPSRVGHRLDDTMWPWNGVTAPPRPSTAPGGGLAPSLITSAPGPSPTVRSMLDHQAVIGGEALGFAYDDVPFEVQAPQV